MESTTQSKLAFTTARLKEKCYHSDQNIENICSFGMSNYEMKYMHGIVGNAYGARAGDAGYSLAI